LRNGYFIETNMDSSSKFAILKKLLLLFEMEDDLIIKFSNDKKVDSKSRFEIRKAFWKQLLPQLKDTTLFLNVNPTKDHWLTTGAGKTGLSFVMIITKKYTAIEFLISRASKQENKVIYNQLLKSKNKIEESFGGDLFWEELPDSKSSRIRIIMDNVNLFHREDWSEMTEFLVENLPKFERSFSSEIKELRF
ncbi:MAG: DUF4268 domain-containing protein, partial [Flavobacteriaceae bacterium]